MVTIPNDPAHPCDKVFPDAGENQGLTKREWFAGQALTRITANKDFSLKNCGHFAVEAADNTIRELNKDSTNKTEGGKGE